MDAMADICLCGNGALRIMLGAVFQKQAAYAEHVPQLLWNPRSVGDVSRSGLPVAGDLWETILDDSVCPDSRHRTYRDPFTACGGMWGEIKIKRICTRISFFAAILPDAEKMLHTEAYGGNSDPADEAHENWFSTRPDQLYNMGIEADGGHCHDDEKLAEFLERAGNKRRKIEYRRHDRGKDKEQNEPGKYFLETKCGASRCIQPLFLPRTYEGQYQGDWDNSEGTREFHDRRLIKRIAAVNPVPRGSCCRDRGSIVDRSTCK